jgi:hypothetical protein
MGTEYIVVGRYSPPDFKAVSQRLERAGVKFEIVCDTSAAGINDQGLFAERGTVTIVVRSKEAAMSAAAVVDAWCLQIGHLKPRDA